MKLQPLPAIATWLLKVFCSSAEDEFLVGDLLEKYQQGGGRFWYWRQVSAIVIVRLYRNVRQLLLSPGALLKRAFPRLLVITVLSVVLLNDIWVIFLIGIAGGVIVAALMSLLGNRAAPTSLDSQASNHPGISIHHIPVEGAVGLLFVFGTLFIFGVGVPAVREIFVFTGPLGVLVFGVLHYWHKYHSVKIESLNLHK